MSLLRTRLVCQTAGESHGPGLVATVLGLPAGLRLDLDWINGELRRRQGGYGRGGRQKIETDTAEVMTGLRRGRTLGSPLTLVIRNKDSRLDDAERTPAVFRPRPGHADLAGSIKWLTTDCRDTLERASARETAARVACGAVAGCLLREVFGVETFGFVRQILAARTDAEVTPDTWRSLREARDASDTYTLDGDATERQRAAIRLAKEEKDTVGGHVECHVFGCPPGVGSSMNWYERLDARLAGAVMGIQAFKAVQIGAGVRAGEVMGSQLHDPIRFNAAGVETPTLGFVRDTNNAGGLEGGMTNGQAVVVTGTMKPISTLLRGMPSVNLNTKSPEQSDYERSDVCAVSAASVVMEHAVAFEVAAAMLDKFGGDSALETGENYQKYLEIARTLPLDPPGETLA